MSLSLKLTCKEMGLSIGCNKLEEAENFISSTDRPWLFLAYSASILVQEGTFFIVESEVSNFIF